VGSTSLSLLVGLGELSGVNSTRMWCHDDVWPDGEAELSIVNGTGWTVEEQLMRMDQLDWTEGILVRQVRVN
jgi:hypothetical protein